MAACKCRRHFSTGTVLFGQTERGRFEEREEEVFDSRGRRRLTPAQVWVDRQGFQVKSKFMFIDGRTGTMVHSETFTQDVVFGAAENVPGLSAYFQLMGCIMPAVLRIVSSQPIRSYRVLLK